MDFKREKINSEKLKKIKCEVNCSEGTKKEEKIVRFKAHKF